MSDLVRTYLRNRKTGRYLQNGRGRAPDTRSTTTRSTHVLPTMRPQSGTTSKKETVTRRQADASPPRRRDSVRAIRGCLPEPGPFYMPARAGETSVTTGVTPVVEKLLVGTISVRTSCVSCDELDLH